MEYPFSAADSNLRDSPSSINSTQPSDASECFYITSRVYSPGFKGSAAAFFAKDGVLNRVAKLENDVEGLKGDVEGLRKEVGDLRRYVDEGFERVDQRFEELKVLLANGMHRFHPFDTFIDICSALGVKVTMSP
jgi:hypothetical protein